MTIEQLLLEKWRSLSPDKQQEVFDFVEFLQSRQASISTGLSEFKSQGELGKQLQQIREKILASDLPLLTDIEIDQEISERRGGYQTSE